MQGHLIPNAITADNDAATPLMFWSLQLPLLAEQAPALALTNVLSG